MGRVLWNASDSKRLMARRAYACTHMTVPQMWAAVGREHAHALAAIERHDQPVAVFCLERMVGLMAELERRGGGQQMELWLRARPTR